MIVESQENQVLLLVVEVPVKDDASTSQVVVEHKLYSRLNKTELLKRAHFFSQLGDLEFRNVDFYQERKKLRTLDAKPLWPLQKQSWTLQDEKNFSVWYTANIKEDYCGGGCRFDRTCEGACEKVLYNRALSLGA